MPPADRGRKRSAARARARSRATERYYSSYRPPPKPKRRTGPTVFQTTPFQPAFKPQQKAARAKTKRARQAQPRATVRPAIPKLSAPTPAQRQTTTRLRTRSRARRQAQDRRQTLTRLARAQERQYQNASRGGIWSASPRIQFLSGRIGYPTLIKMTRAQQLAAGKASEAKFGKDKYGTFSANLKDTSSYPEIKADIEKLRQGKQAQLDIGLQRQLEKQGVNFASSPAMVLLRQLQRPVHALAGAADVAAQYTTKGKTPNAKAVLRGAKKGITLEEEKYFGDVLERLGAPKGVAAAGGFALDVLADPTTYVTLGRGSIARKEAEREALAAARRAAKAGKAKGYTPEQTARLVLRQRDRARGRAMRKREHRVGRAGDTGIELRFAGRAVPKTLKGTAAVGKAIGKAKYTRPGRVVARKTESGRAIARTLGAAGHAGVRSTRVTKRERPTTQALKRESRATRNYLARRSQERANALADMLTAEEKLSLPLALERGSVKSLQGAAKIKLPGRRAGFVGPRIPAPVSRPIRSVRTRGQRAEQGRVRTAGLITRSELRYQRRQRERAGVPSTIAQPSRPERLLRSRAERPPARSSVRVQAALKPAVAEFKRAATAKDQARAAVRAAEPGPAKAKARRKFSAASDKVDRLGVRVENLSNELRGAERAERIAGAAKRGERTLATRRRATEAQEYYPRHDVDQTLPLGERIKRAGRDVEFRPKERVGTNKPESARTSVRELRAPREQLPPETVAQWMSDPRIDLARSGAKTGGVVAAAELNRKLVTELGIKVPANITKEKMEALARGENPIHVYKVTPGGEFVPLGVENIDEIQRAANRFGMNRTRPGEKPRSTVAGQYALIPQRLINEVRDAHTTIAADNPIAMTFDAAQGGFKSLALATPSYLTRNFSGDLWNARLYEGNFLKQGKHLFQGFRALNALGRYERGLRSFALSVPKDLREVKLTDNQANALRDAGLPVEGNSVNALQMAMVAESVGAIRQGRFLELMEEPRARKRGEHKTRWWQNVTKRVEDTVRIGTFMSALERGSLPREAAEIASRFHFDYGDLTSVEKGVFRRIAPFYTFPSRNIPLQVKGLVKTPGRYATVGKAIGEGANLVDAPDDWMESLDPYERRQLGIPFKTPHGWGTFSLGSPFVDLQDPVGSLISDEGKFRPSWNAAIQRGAEMMGPWKTPLELAENVSFFYRDQIQPTGRGESQETTVPGWAIKLAKGPGGEAFARMNGIRTNSTLPGGWAWPRKSDYFWRQASVGPIGSVLRAPGVSTLLGAGKTARGQGTFEQALGVAGVRVRQFDKGTMESALYDRNNELEDRLGRLRDTRHPRNGQPISAENPTPEYQRLLKQQGRLQVRLGIRKAPQAKQSGEDDSGLYLGDLSPSSKSGKLYLDDLK